MTFTDGSSAAFDLVVGADGIHSATRKLVLTHDEVENFDTGWGGFVVWSAPDGGVRRMRTSLLNGSDAAPYAEQSWRHSERAVSRLDLKLARE